jgi:hypothetical protein
MVEKSNVREDRARPKTPTSGANQREDRVRPQTPAPEVVTEEVIKKPAETKAQIDARVAAANAKVTEGLKPVQSYLESQGVKIDPTTGLYVTGPTGGATGSTGPTLTAEQIAANDAAQLLAQQQAQINADNLANRKSAYDLLFTEFNRYGLAALVEPLKGLVQENVTPSEFTIRLQETKAYKDRFAANAERLANGLSALSPAEYILMEDKYQEVMRKYGLPSSYYAKDTMGTQAGFQKLLELDVSSDELKERIELAQDRVINAAPLVKDALKQFYPDITDGDILAYTLDPSKGLENIKRKVTAAEIGGAAMGQNLKTSAKRAEELARFGVTAEAAREGYETIAERAPRGSQLAAIYGQDAYGQTEAEQEQFGLTGSAEAKAKRKKLSELERSAFSGQAGTTAGALARDRAGSF